MACLDTTVFVDLHRPKSPYHQAASQKLVELLARGEVLATTRFNVAELLLGVHLAQDKEQELRKVRKFLSGLEILGFHNRAAWLYGKITAFLRRKGHPVGQMDVLIASTALSVGHLIVTRNPNHFAQIPGLIIESY